MVQQETSCPVASRPVASAGSGFYWQRRLATGTCPLLCCSANVGRFTLDCQIPGAGYARLVLRAADDGLCCPARSHALHAQACCPRLRLHPAMPCHHAMAQSKPHRPESSPVKSSPVKSSEASFQVSNDGNCCQSHCCCGATTSEWAQPASNLLSCLSLPIEPARPYKTRPFTHATFPETIPPAPLLAANALLKPSLAILLRPRRGGSRSHLIGIALDALIRSWIF